MRKFVTRRTVPGWRDDEISYATVVCVAQCTAVALRAPTKNSNTFLSPIRKRQKNMRRINAFHNYSYNSKRETLNICIAFQKYAIMQ